MGNTHSSEADIRASTTLTSRSPTFNPGEDIASNLILVAILAVVLLFAGFGVYVIAKKHALVRMAAMKESARSNDLELKDIEKDAGTRVGANGGVGSSWRIGMN